MGSRQSVRPQTEDWRDSEWQKISSQLQTFSRSSTLRSMRTGAMVDQYQLGWQNREQYQFYLQSFNWRSRRRNSGPIVGSIGIKEMSREGMCNGKWAANIYLQHIGVRLSQIQDIPLSDSLYIILTALQGYEQLYMHAGYFRIEEEQICLQRGGRVRVWVNCNLSTNYPEVDAQSQGLRRDETHMVKQLVDIVEANTDPDQLLHQSFSSFLISIKRREGCPVGFQRAQLAVLDYARINGLIIPNRLEAALELYETCISQRPVKSTIYEAPLQSHESRIVQQVPSYQQLANYQSMPNLHQFPHYYHNPFVQAPPVYQPQPAQHLPVTFNHFEGVNNQYPSQNFINAERFSHFQQNDNNPESSTQILKISRPTTNTKSHVANIEESPQNFSVNLRPERRERSVGGSQRGPNSMNQQRGGKQWIRYSQNIQDLAREQFSSLKFHKDAFGLNPHQRRFMKESSSSYQIQSSNSSRSPLRPSHHSSYRNSRKQSAKASSKKSKASEQLQVPKTSYFVDLGNECALDPEIAADIAKYLG